MGFRTYVVVPSGMTREIYTIEEHLVRMQPDVFPCGVVTRNCFVLESYSRYRHFAITYAIIQNDPLKTPHHVCMKAD